MEIKEAVKVLKIINFSRAGLFLTWEEMSEVKDKAIDALEKQIPKKPIINKANLTDFQDFHCPSCNKKIISRLDGEFIAGRLQKYCADCGQALDWSDEE